MKRPKWVPPSGRGAWVFLLVVFLLGGLPAQSFGQTESAPSETAPSETPSDPHFRDVPDAGDRQVMMQEEQQKSYEKKMLCTRAIVEYLDRRGVQRFENIFFNRDALLKALQQEKHNNLENHDDYKLHVMVGNHLKICDNVSLQVFSFKNGRWAFFSHATDRSKNKIEPEDLKYQWEVFQSSRLSQ